MVPPPPVIATSKTPKFPRNVPRKQALDAEHHEAQPRQRRPSHNQNKETKADAKERRAIEKANKALHEAIEAVSKATIASKKADRASKKAALRRRSLSAVEEQPITSILRWPSNNNNDNKSTSTVNRRRSSLSWAQDIETTVIFYDDSETSDITSSTAAN